MKTKKPKVPKPSGPIDAIPVDDKPKEAAPAPEVVPPMFPPESMGIFFDVLGRIEAFAAARMMGVSAEIAARAFAYSEVEKKLLAPPLAKILNKWAPLWLIKYQDELMFLGLFLTITSQKVLLCKAMDAAFKRTQTPTPEPAPTPAKEPEPERKPS